MIRNRLITIAKYSIWEAVRDKFFLFLIFGIILTVALSLFVGELAITESTQTRTEILSYVLRLFSVFTVSLFVITSMLREFSDKGFELILSHPIPRGIYFFGKLTGFAFISFIVATLVACCLYFYIPSSAILFWSFSLFCELLIIITLSLLCLFTLNTITISFSMVIAFYVLARSIEVIHLISNSPIISSSSLSNKLINWGIDGISYLIPDLYRFTQTEWLIYGVDFIDESKMLISQTVIYVLFLSGIALFDLYRKEL